MSLEKNAKKILAAALVGFILFYSLYLLLLSNFEPRYEKEPAVYFVMIFYALISLIAIVSINRKRLHIRHILIAGALGFLSITMVLPRNGNTPTFQLPGLSLFVVLSVNLLSGVTVALGFLLAGSLASEYDIQKRLIHPLTVKNVLFYCGILSLFVLIFWALTKFRPPNAISIWEISSFVGAGVSEEVLFRLLPYAFALHLSRGKNDAKLLTFLLMTIPFTLLHFFAQILSVGFFATLPALLQTWIVAAIPLALLFLKRDLFTAISVHILWDVLAIIFG